MIIKTEQKQYLTEKEVSKLTGFSPGKLRNARYLSRGLPYLKTGKCVRYFLSDVVAYMETNKIIAAE